MKPIKYTDSSGREHTLIFDASMNTELSRRAYWQDTNFYTNYLDCKVFSKRTDVHPFTGEPRTIQQHLFYILTMQGCCGVVTICSSDRTFLELPKEVRQQIIEWLRTSYSALVLHTVGELTEELKSEGWEEETLGINPKTGRRLVRFTLKLN